ncbi:MULTISPECIES: hypothetical protein [Arthrobacter]|uniref:Integral membrane protein n=2 Tax=Arthrobacter TaxID=1663 RepID=A0ABU9KJX5_9MICC|nr:hypothetical protein [Arthrobacter sp. YJM1]MDP5227136.1 hypothetical protein [Arthrobacter sp. YJM1]
MTAGPRPAGVLLRPAQWPWWLQVSPAYAAARFFSFLVFTGAAFKQGPNPWMPEAPGYWDFITIWDGRWYLNAAEHGYPSVLPVDAMGNVQESTWAFYPVLPVLGKGLSGLLGIPVIASMTVIAMVAGLLAALVVFRLFRHFASHRTALWGTVFVASFPVSGILQVPYAESLNLLFLAAAMLALVRRRYVAAMPFVVLAALSRPTGVPFAAVVGLLWAHRLWTLLKERRRPGAEELPSLLWHGALAVLSCAAALAWPALAWARTGDPEAYTKTETVWRGGGLVPFKPWWDMAVGTLGPVLGPFALAAFLAGFAWVLLKAFPVRRIGVELRLWCACYMVYLLAFLQPQTSTFRMLLPLFPLGLATAFVSRSTAYRWSVVVMFSLLQIVWIVWLWAWAQLPGGGDYPP